MHLSMNDMYQYVFGNRAVITNKKKDPAQQSAYDSRVKEKIRVKFQAIVNGHLSRRFRKLLREINNKELEVILFDNNTDVLPPPNVSVLAEERLVQAFHTINDKYSYFDKADTATLSYFIAISRACQLMLVYKENSEANDEFIYFLAYKILIFFGVSNDRNIFSNLESFMKKHAGGSKQALNDILPEGLPLYDKSIDLLFWRKMIMQHGKSVLPLFSIAPQIVKILPQGHFSLQEAKRAAAELYYPRGKEYPALAELCHLYHIDEADFNKCLDQFEPIRKKRDNLPDIVIAGKDVNFPGYYLVKLPINDPKIYVLGNITNNCARIGGEGEQCIVDALLHEDCGFYVLLKAYQAKKDAAPIINDEINYNDFALVGHGYTWISKFNNLTFDSWENQRKEIDDAVIAPLLKKFCEIIAKEGRFKRVTIGTGGKTPAIFSQQITFSEIIREGVQSPDSYRQGILYDSLKGDEEIESYKARFMQEIEEGLALSLEEKMVLKELIAINIPYKHYFDLIRELFLYPIFEFSWKEIFKRSTGKEIFLAKVKENGALFLDFLLKLKQLNLLTEEIYLMFVENLEKGMWFITVLSILQKANIAVTPSIFIKAMGLMLSNNIERVAQLIKLAYKLEILNTDMFIQFINLSENMDDILAIECLIDQLTRYSIQDNEVLRALLTNLSVIREVCAMSILLTHTGKMTRENILAAIHHCKDHADNLPLLWQKMQCFHEDKWIDKENFQSFFMAEEYNYKLKIENMIIILSNLGMLDKKTFSLVLNVASQCHVNDFNFLISLFETMRLGFKCENEQFLYILERPQPSIALFKKLKDAGLLTLYVWDVIADSLPHIEDVLNGLITIKRYSRYHARKDIFNDFMEYFHLRNDCVDRTKIVYEWALDYIRFKQENPFAILEKVEGQSGLAFFSQQENAVATFKKFITGGPPHPELWALFDGSPVNHASISIMPSLRRSQED